MQKNQILLLLTNVTSSDIAHTPITLNFRSLTSQLLNLLHFACYTACVSVIVYAFARDVFLRCRVRAWPSCVRSHVRAWMSCVRVHCILEVFKLFVLENLDERYSLTFYTSLVPLHASP